MTPPPINLRVLLPAGNSDTTAVVRVYSPGFELLSEGMAGDVVQVPAGTGYLASAYAPDGDPIGLPTRFDAQAGGDVQEVRVDARNSPLSQDPPATRRRFAAARIAAVIAATDAPTYSAAVLSLTPGAWTNDHGPAIVVVRQVPTRAPGTAIASHLGETSLNKGEALFLTFPGPEGSLRQAVVPFDFRGGIRVRPDLRWSAARSGGFFLPEFTFNESTLDALVTALRYRRGSLAQPIARKLAARAFDALADKTQSPLAAVLGGLILLRDDPGKLRDIESWTANLFNWFPDFPDSLPLRVDLLARMGRHREARALLNELPVRGVPWTRHGLTLLVERLSFYSQTETINAENFKGEAQRTLASWYRGLLAMTHPACVFCVYETQQSQSALSVPVLRFDSDGLEQASEPALLQE